uniref:Olfactory receptor n=1 Tax=Pyxicephalus adspersus TaxID=30357 RepID=A0AAV3ASD5_PYXAD|nr:TPA: hypothetical protein GDO54_009957 [Pyxicephalus adspersus]
MSNHTHLKEFILVGFPENMQICVLYFAVLLLIYILTVLGNSFLICTVILSPKLHTPMYFFLCNLSFLDLCYSSSSVPKILIDVLSKKRRISFLGCMVQMNTGLFFGSIECLLLAVMAYDRYMAICFPLYYTNVMNHNICWNITGIMWLGGFFISVVPTISKPLIFCTKNKLNHFACEILALLELACGNLAFYKITIFVVSIFTILAPLVFIVVTYVLIIISIMKIQSIEGRSKAFSTCASHLFVVFMFYGTSMTMYLGQTNYFSFSLKYISLIYGVITPVLNPLIYSLRNNEVKEGFQKTLRKFSL